MPKPVRLREVSEAEKEQLEKLSRSRTAAAREVQRARLVVLFLQGHTPETIADAVGCALATVYNQLSAFNQRGLAFLKDAPRSGRPLTYTEAVRGQIVATAKTAPEQLGQPFGHWTLTSLVRYLHQHLNIPMKRTQVLHVLHEEGVRWYQEKTYFTERPDPQFAEKRGRL